MTEQYAQPNINNPRLTRSFVAGAVPTIAQLTFDDQLVTVDTTANPFGFSLPLASQFPTWEIIIKATNAGTSGNPVPVGTFPGSGETIDGAGFVILTTDQEVLFLKSDGENWRVVAGGTGPAPTTGVSLDITFDTTAVASVAPILFVTWPEVTAAIAAIPSNPGATYDRTKYRLNVNTLSSVDPGIHDLTNAIFRSAIKSSPGGGGATSPFSGLFTFENTAQVNGISVGALTSLGPTFTWPDFTFAEMIDCAFLQSANGAPGPGIIFIDGFMILRCYGQNSFGLASIEISGGSRLVIEAYGRVALTSGAVLGSGDLDLVLFGGASNVSLLQPGLSGTLELNIGGGQAGSASEEFSNGETILFSSGGPIDFSTTNEQEIYPGGLNPSDDPPQVPAFVAPFKGYVAPKNGYLRGIGVRIPTIFTGAPGTFTVRVYVSGALTLIETFSWGSPSQFFADTFGQYEEGDGITVTVTADSLTSPPGVLTDGIMVSLRSS